MLQRRAKRVRCKQLLDSAVSVCANTRSSMIARDMGLNDALRARYSAALETDRSKKFDDEFARTTNLEREILDEHGESGAKFLLERAGCVPSTDGTCPWQLDGLTAIASVRRVLQPLRKRLPEFLAELEARVRWVIPTRQGNEWVLTYVCDHNLYDGRAYYEILFGGPPNGTPRLSDRATSLGWLIPRSVSQFYAIHDGLVSTSRGILATSGLVDLGEIMDPIAAEQRFRPSGYTFQDLLEFSPDGAGNCQAFHRRRRDDSDPPTVDWDHETREISGEMDFWKFADEALLREILDEE